MRILITGSAGMLGQDLVAHFAARHEVMALDRRRTDITDADAVMRAFKEARPEAVIHAAALADVDECERQPALAFRTNSEGARNVALACREVGAAMLQVSTDYVFDGEKTEPYLESDPVNPVSVYGRSKLEGERHVLALLECSWVVRVAWLFGPLGKNFVSAILARAEQGGPLRVVSDQVGSPTYTGHLGAKMEEILTRGGPGIYHLTHQGGCSRFEFAQEILRQAGLRDVVVLPITSAEAGRLARRPKNSRLAPARLEREGIALLPSWQDGLRAYLARTTLPAVARR